MWHPCIPEIPMLSDVVGTCKYSRYVKEGREGTYAGWKAVGHLSASGRWGCNRGDWPQKGGALLRTAEIPQESVQTSMRLTADKARLGSGEARTRPSKTTFASPLSGCDPAYLVHTPPPSDPIATYHLYHHTPLIHRYRLSFPTLFCKIPT